MLDRMSEEECTTVLEYGQHCNSQTSEWRGYEGSNDSYNQEQSNSNKKTSTMATEDHYGRPSPASQRHPPQCSPTQNPLTKAAKDCSRYGLDSTSFNCAASDGPGCDISCDQEVPQISKSKKRFTTRGCPSPRNSQRQRETPLVDDHCSDLVECSYTSNAYKDMQISDSVTDLFSQRCSDSNSQSQPRKKRRPRAD